MHRLLLVSIFAAAPILAAAAPAPAKSRPARCSVWSGDSARWRGPCLFTPHGGGSFSISRAKGPFPGDVEVISVTLTGRGNAEVRGLTRDGVNSRWGGATRSRKDPACWEGDDFEVCAR